MSAGAATAGGRPGGSGGTGSGGPPRPGGPGPGGPGGGGPMGGLFVQAQKSSDFTGTVKRLARRLRPQAAQILGVIAMSVVSVVLAIMGPKLLGQRHHPDLRGLLSPRSCLRACPSTTSSPG